MPWHLLLTSDEVPQSGTGQEELFPSSFILPSFPHPSLLPSSFRNAFQGSSTPNTAAAGEATTKWFTAASAKAAKSQSPFAGCATSRSAPSLCECGPCGGRGGGCCWGGASRVLFPCTRRWAAEGWEHCTKTCGGSGYQIRTVRCIQPLHDGANRSVHFKYCSGDRPESRRPCNRVPCPAWWKAGPWSEVGEPRSAASDVPRRPPRASQARAVPGLSAPGCAGRSPASWKWAADNVLRLWQLPGCRGNQRREGPQCHTHGPMMRPERQPRAAVDALVNSTLPWKPNVPTGPVSVPQCSVTCGEGTETRQITCRAGEQCDGEKPESVRVCKLAPCNGKRAAHPPRSVRATRHGAGEGRSDARNRRAASRFLGMLAL